MLALGRLLELTLAGREPAEKIQLTREGARLHWLSEGVLEVTPAVQQDCGLDLLLSAGIHGNETAPIELLDRLLQGVASGQLQPRARVLFLLGNPEAMRRGERFVEQDINCLFDGRHEQSSGSEALRAGELERHAANFFARAGRVRLHYDLHSARRGSRIGDFALHPYAEGRKPSRAELIRLQAAGVAAVLLPRETGTTFSAYTYARLGAEAFALELGTARPFGRNAGINLERLEKRLRELIENCEAQGGSLDSLQLFAVSREIIKHSDAFRLHLPEDVENFTELAQGLLLAEDIAGTRWLVEEQGARIIFPNPRVGNGQRAGILIVPVTL